MLIHSIKLKNFLSFGPQESEVKLQPLSVIIGPNASGKSNFLEAFEFLRTVPSNLGSSIRSGGGIQDWLWKGPQSKSEENPVSTVEAIFESPKTDTKHLGRLCYKISFYSEQSRFRLLDEILEAERPLISEKRPFSYYRYDNGNPVISEKKNLFSLVPELYDSNASILSQVAYPPQFPEFSYLAKNMSHIRLYKDWGLGFLSPIRNMQATDLPNQILQSDYGNLALVLNQIRMNQKAKQRFLEELQNFYEEVVDFDTFISGNTLQIVFLERGLESPVPATRLSDGVLRYLTLIAILCNPTLPPLICIDEPELGLHPDAIPRIATLLQETSEKCQIIVTTHSQIFIESFDKHPEAVLVCEKSENGTNLTRLDKVALEPWLRKYSLAELWARGDIGGNPW